MTKEKPIKSMLGKSLPKLTLKNSQGEDVPLSDLKGKKVILYFYPKDSTPGCTTQGNEFSDLYTKFKKQNCEVFGVSRDSVKSHDKFRCKYGFGFELLADEDEKLCKYFDVIQPKNMYGKAVIGIQRSTFIFDESGKVVQEFRKVKAEGHAAEMLEVIKSL